MWYLIIIFSSREVPLELELFRRSGYLKGWDRRSAANYPNHWRVFERVVTPVMSQPGEAGC